MFDKRPRLKGEFTLFDKRPRLKGEFTLFNKQPRLKGKFTLFDKQPRSKGKLFDKFFYFLPSPSRLTYWNCYEFLGP